MKIHVTEHKSTGALRPVSNTVRVFVDNDYQYGYFVPEDQLFALLDAEQQATYLAVEDVKLDVTPQVAQQIIDMGATPYTKAKVA